MKHLRSPSGTYGTTIWYVYSIAFERFESGSSWIRDVFETYQILYQRKYLFWMGLSKSNTCRIRLEPWFEYIRSRGSPFTNPDGGILGALDKYLLHCIRTFRTGFEPGSIIIKCIQRYVFFDVVFDTSRSDSNPVRNTSVYKVHKVHEFQLMQQRSQNTFTRFTSSGRSNSDTYSKFKRYC